MINLKCKSFGNQYISITICSFQIYIFKKAFTTYAFRGKTLLKLNSQKLKYDEL